MHSNISAQDKKSIVSGKITMKKRVQSHGWVGNSAILSGRYLSPAVLLRDSAPNFSRLSATSAAEFSSGELVTTSLMPESLRNELDDPSIMPAAASAAVSSCEETKICNLLNSSEVFNSSHQKLELDSNYLSLK